MDKKISHMAIPWHEYVRTDDDVQAIDAPLPEKASIIARIGVIMLSCGTPAWRVRNVMTTAAITLGVSCNAEIGLNAINYTVTGKHDGFSQSISIEGISVNTYKLARVEKFIRGFNEKCHDYSVEGIHCLLDDIQKTPELHSIPMLTFAAAAACAAFAFLLGAGLEEIICVFIGAAAGQLIRKLLLEKKLSLIISIACAAAVACGVYALVMLLARLIFAFPAENGAGYICSVLFLVPGFPFITSVLDLAKLDMRSGIERLVYSSIIMLFATLFAWAAALVFGFEAESLAGLSLPPVLLLVLRLIASFIGIYGFSMMFNSTHLMALTAALVGMMPNVLRIMLSRNLGVPGAISAFIGAFLAGMIALIAVRITSFPRASITIPSVIVAVPGFLIYKAIYFFGTGAAEQGLSPLIEALGIILGLALGILFSRFIADPQFRHRD